MVEEERPYRCSTCAQTFTRANHLKRHSRLHDSGYRCLCEQTFSRNDALSRHLRHCAVAQRDPETVKKFLSTGPKKQTRDKRACDHCASLKLKCTFQQPCDQCRRKSLTCMYTRNGYVDPYENFRIEKEKSCEQPTAHQELPHDASLRRMSELQSVDLSHTLLSQGSVAPLAASGMLGLSSLAYSENDIARFSTQDSSDRLSMDFSSADFDFAADLTFPFPSVFDTNLSSLSWDLTPEAGPPILDSCASVTGDVQSIATHLASPPQMDGFSLAQLDPVEAKCTDIRVLLRGTEPRIHRDDLNDYITRKNVLLCGQLFGRHLSRNIPIVHTPSFKLAEAPPMLLLAITLGGACYSENAIPPRCITQFTKGLLISIERQMHEIDMLPPSLSTVQASLIACCVLLSSRYDGARRFASIHFARCISMADRLGIFAEEEMDDYTSLTEPDFNWFLWIERESRRRVACEMFSLDMAFCVFLGKSPYFSTFSFRTRMPCHEKSWEASASGACLRYLRDLAPQMDVATGMNKLRNLGDEEPPTLKISEFGMFILMLALHSSLLRIIQEERQPHLSPQMIQTLPQVIDPFRPMHQKVRGDNLAVLADMAIDSCGSQATKQCNKTLKAWKRVWDWLQRGQPGTTTRPFSTDPLPFWYLAKLYQVLYLFDGFVGREIDLELPMGRGSCNAWRTEVNDKIISWLSDFREQASPKDLNTQQHKPTAIPEASREDSVLPRLMNA